MVPRCSKNNGGLAWLDNLSQQPDQGGNLVLCPAARPRLISICVEMLACRHVSKAFHNAEKTCRVGHYWRPKDAGKVGSIITASA